MPRGSKIHLAYCRALAVMAIANSAKESFLGYGPVQQAWQKQAEVILDEFFKLVEDEMKEAKDD